MDNDLTHLRRLAGLSEAQSTSEILNETCEPSPEPIRESAEDPIAEAYKRFVAESGKEVDEGFDNDGIVGYCVAEMRLGEVVKLWGEVRNIYEAEMCAKMMKESSTEDGTHFKPMRIYDHKRRNR